ncbi:MAG: peptidoglycan-binding domain-containing protein [Patescibacteria group bacterium]
MTLNKQTKLVVLGIAIVVGLFSLVTTTASVAHADDEAFVPAQSGDNSSVDVPASAGSNDNITAPLVPANTGGNGNENTDPLVPTGSGQSDNDTNGTDAATPSNGGNNPGGSNPGGNGSVGNGSTGSGGSSGGSVLLSGTVAGNTILSNSCPLISSTMLKRGIANNQAEVAKLQAYLKASEGMNVSVTGTFDIETELAVRAFQKKYASDILLPWGGTKTSGIVYITTAKKINQLACAQPLSLSSADMAVISNFRAHLGSASNGTDANNMTTQSETDSSAMTGTTGTSTATSSDDVFGSADQDTNVANTASNSLASRFWNFIVNLFR